MRAGRAKGARAANRACCQDGGRLGPLRSQPKPFTSIAVVAVDLGGQAASDSPGLPRSSSRCASICSATRHRRFPQKVLYALEEILGG
jgi:hypothetical protein